MIMDIETIIETNTSMRTQELLPPPNTSLASPASSPWPGLDITNTSLAWAWQGLDSLDWSQVLVWDHECPHWQPLHHLYYQLAHLTLLLASLLPLGSPLTSLLLRLGLVTHSSLLTAWALLTPACSLDSLTWALTLLAVNTTLLLRSGLSLASLHCGSLQPEVRAAYDTLFRPLGVDRKQFKKLLSCTKEIREVSPKEVVITEKISRVDCLSLVLSGRLIVSQAGRALHLVNKNQFLDSPEWFGVTTDEYFQVSVTALEPCTLLTWHRDRVKFCLMEDAKLQAIFDHVVGRDVVRKLMQVNNLAEELQLNLDKVAGDKADSSSSGSSEEKEDYDDKKPMIAKEVIKEKSLLGSLIGGDIPNWRLVNIKETEDETIV